MFPSTRFKCIRTLLSWEHKKIIISSIIINFVKKHLQLVSPSDCLLPVVIRLEGTGFSKVSEFYEEINCQRGRGAAAIRAKIQARVCAWDVLCVAALKVQWRVKPSCWHSSPKPFKLLIVAWIASNKLKAISPGLSIGLLNFSLQSLYDRTGDFANYMNAAIMRQ